MINAKRLFLINSSKYSLLGYLKAKYTTNTKVEVNLSDTCVKRLQEIKDPKKFLRVSVESGGCSGFEYKFSLDSKLINSQDIVIEKENCKVVIDQETLNLIKGSTIDYYEELIKSGFRVINNPIADHGCSCGSSFSIR